MRSSRHARVGYSSTSSTSFSRHQDRSRKPGTPDQAPYRQQRSRLRGHRSCEVLPVGLAIDRGELVDRDDLVGSVAIGVKGLVTSDPVPGRALDGRWS